VSSARVIFFVAHSATRSLHCAFLGTFCLSIRLGWNPFSHFGHGDLHWSRQHHWFSNLSLARPHFYSHNDLSRFSCCDVILSIVSFLPTTLPIFFKRLCRDCSFIEALWSLSCLALLRSSPSS
jgi:hypothetical protein